MKRLVLLVVALAMSWGCRSPQCAGGSAVKKKDGVVDLNGTWLVSSEGGEREMNLEQHGDTITGETADGAISGELNGNRLTLRLEGDAATGTGIVEGDSIAGEYTSIEDDQSGTWQAERIEE